MARLDRGPPARGGRLSEWWNAGWLELGVFGSIVEVREVIFVDSVPTTHLGKVDRGQLRVKSGYQL